MAKQKVLLNTACRATFKDGHTEDFSSIEEASSSTGVSEASIKIRANKPGATGKDKITFEWLNAYTKRYYMAKKSKSKGKGLEYEVVKKLKEIGYEGVVTASSESKRIDNAKIDIYDTNQELPINIQCKHTQTLPSYYKIKEACPDKTKPFTLCWKKAAEGGASSLGTLYLVPDDFFYKLLECYRANHSCKT